MHTQLGWHASTGVAVFLTKASYIITNSIISEHKLQTEPNNRTDTLGNSNSPFKM